MMQGRGPRRVEAPYAAPPRLPRRPAYLKLADRCDGCGSRAYVAAEIDGVDLRFCGFHFRVSETLIRSTAAELVDERWQLVEEERLRHEQ